MTNASRAGLLTTHNNFCRIYAPGFPGATHREAIVYISVLGNQSPARKIELLFVVSESKGAWNFSHFQIFLQKKKPPDFSGVGPHLAILYNGMQYFSILERKMSKTVHPSGHKYALTGIAADDGCVELLSGSFDAVE